MRGRVAPALANRLRGVPAWLGQLAGPYPPGHFHSPLPDMAEIRERDEELFRVPVELPGIDLRAESQLALVPRFRELLAEMPFEHGPRDGLRYCLANKWFAHGD